MERTAKARKVLHDLDSELAASSQRAGATLVWTVSDRELLTLIADTIDRREDLAAHYASADEVKTRHEVDWIPPPNLDTGQTRVNNYHRPEQLLRPPDDPTTDSDNTTHEDHEPGGPEPNAA